MPTLFAKCTIISPGVFHLSNTHLYCNILSFSFFHCSLCCSYIKSDHFKLVSWIQKACDMYSASLFTMWNLENFLPPLCLHLYPPHMWGWCENSVKYAEGGARLGAPPRAPPTGSAGCTRSGAPLRPPGGHPHTEPFMEVQRDTMKWKFIESQLYCMT